MESVIKMYEQVGNLCFKPDGVAKRGLLLMHLVMRRKEDEGVEIMKWLGGHVSKNLFINIMEQYTPDARVGRTSRSAKGTPFPSSQGSTEVAKPGGRSLLSGQAASIRYVEINRPVNDGEVLAARKAVEGVGLWRFCDPPRHKGLNIWLMEGISRQGMANCAVSTR